MTIKCTGIDHIHFNVPNLNRFREILGQLFDVDVTPTGHLEALGLYNMTMNIAGAEAPQPFLDVFQSASGESVVAKFMNDKGPCVSFIAFRVEAGFGGKPCQQLRTAGNIARRLSRHEAGAVRHIR